MGFVAMKITTLTSKKSKNKQLWNYEEGRLLLPYQTGAQVCNEFNLAKLEIWTREPPADYSRNIPSKSLLHISVLNRIEMKVQPRGPLTMDRRIVIPTLH